MATAIHSFDKLQVGPESTKGTPVAATVELVGDGTMVEEIDFYRSPHPRGQRMPTGAAGVIVRKGSELSIATDLTAEEFPWVLASGIRNVSPSTSNDESTWTVAPELTTYPTLKSGTFEVVRADGSTNHYAVEFDYGLTRSFSIDWAVNDSVKLSWQVFGRAASSTTPTGALSPYSDREPLTGNLLKVYSDTAWANLGNTQLTGMVRSASLQVTTGLEPDYTLDGQTDKDFTVEKLQDVLRATLSMTMELDATGAAEAWTAYRANDIQYIRMNSIGSDVNTNARYVQIDGAYRFTAPPSVSDDGEVKLVQVSLEASYDETGSAGLSFKTMSGVAAL